MFVNLVKQMNPSVTNCEYISKFIINYASIKLNKNFPFK